MKLEINLRRAIRTLRENPMKTILCYAFGTPQAGTIWDLCQRLGQAEIDYMHDCLTGMAYVRIDDAARADAAIRTGGLAAEGRMTSLPENDWPSFAEIDFPLDPADIDWDPRETWCAGPPPRYAL